MNEQGDEPILRERGYLPHWERAGAIYFVTFRLADSLPRHVVEQLANERERMERQVTNGRRPLSEQEREGIRKALAARVEKYLDAGIGSCVLRRSELADLVASSLRHFDGARYRLMCWCVMPNHVHVIMQPLNGHSLASILHSWKSFTANAANHLLNRSGEFWQREYYDRSIRSERHLEQAIQYVVNNPIKADLQNWPWVEVSHKAIAGLAGDDTDVE